MQEKEIYLGLDLVLRTLVLTGKVGGGKGDRGTGAETGGKLRIQE
jgi:hypothetical protein